MDNNRRLKLLHGALLLTDADIARAVTLGGIPTSRNRAKSWLRGNRSTRVHSGAQQRRFVEITQEELDAFLIGLKPLMEELEQLHQDASTEEKSDIPPSP